MKKYSMIVVAIAAVVLMAVDSVSAGNPENSGTQNGTNATWQNTSTGSGSQTTTQPTQTQTQNQTRTTGQYGSNQGSTTQQTQQAQQTQQGQQTQQAQQTTQARKNVQQVRVNSQNQYGNVFTSQWYAKNPNAWQNTKSVNMWTPVNSWTTLANWVNVDTDEPADYVLVYEEDTYYLNDQPMPAEEYLFEIIDLATPNQSETATTNPNDWMPLGVFVVTPVGSTQTPNRVFQFAMHKNGQLAGTCYDASSGKPIRITGSLDKENQRVAWTLGENSETVMETSLGNFVESQSTVTVHQGGNTETMTMVRLEGPVKQTQTSTSNQGSTGSNQQN